jgi:plasmid stabilization system protein ParE
MPSMARHTVIGGRTYRRHEHRSHTIILREIEGGILIVRVLHARMDPQRHLRR